MKKEKEGFFSRLVLSIGVVFTVLWAILVCVYIHPLLVIPMAAIAWWVKTTDETEKLERQLREKENLTRLREKEIYADTLARANTGDASAQYDLGMIVLSGCGCAKNPKIGRAWIQAASERDEPRALYWLGKEHSTGALLPKDYELSLRYLEKAMLVGNTHAGGDIPLVRQLLHDERVRKINQEALAAEESKWLEFKPFLDKCESLPEKTLLKALIRHSRLRPAGDVLQGDLLVAQQKNILQYRVDFFINGNLVVEVDGKSYHSDDVSFERDRIRDQEIFEAYRYTTLRFPASQVLSNPLAVAERISKSSAPVSV